jgi:hypothetical protein
MSGGRAFGDAALIKNCLRSADVRADALGSCWALKSDGFARLKHEWPSLMTTLLHNLLQSQAETTARLTAEVTALESRSGVAARHGTRQHRSRATCVPASAGPAQET